MRVSFGIVTIIVLVFSSGRASTGIDITTWMQEKLQISGPEEIGLPKCGFPLLLEAYRRADPEIFHKIKQFQFDLQWQTYQTILSPSGHFLIHYQIEGYDAIPFYDRNEDGQSDYLEFVVMAFDRAWNIEIDHLGFRPPPDSSGKPVQTYDVYCRNISLYGRTFFDLEDEITSLPGNNYPSFIEISTNFSFVTYPQTDDPVVRDSLAIAVTAAHEFNHAIQLGYHIWNLSSNPLVLDTPDLWFIENSATYMEEVVADEVNDYYRYLDAYFHSTDQSLIDTFPITRIYGEIVLNIMLGELYGKSITREIWEEIPDQIAVEALNEVLAQKTSSLTREIQRLATWIFFTGSAALTEEYFPEASAYPSPPAIVTDVYRQNLQKVFEEDLPSLAFQYLKVPVSPNSFYEIFLYTEIPLDNWFGVHLSFQEPFARSFIPFVYLSVKTDAFDQFIYTSVGRGDVSDGDQETAETYQLYMKESTQPSAGKIMVYPNIVRPGQRLQRVVFSNLPANARVEIFSSNGTHINTLYPEFSQPVVFWDLQTKQHQPVASGVYLYRVVSSTVSQSGKVLIVQ